MGMNVNKLARAFPPAGRELSRYCFIYANHSGWRIFRLTSHPICGRWISAMDILSVFLYILSMDYFQWLTFLPENHVALELRSHFGEVG